MKKLLRASMMGLVLLSGCMTLPDGTEVPNTKLIQDLTTVSTTVIVGEVKKRGLDPNEVLKHVQNARQLVKETPEGQLVDLNAINAYMDKYVPADYQVVGRLIVALVTNRVEPIINSKIEESQKAKLVIDVIVAVLDGVEAGVLIHGAVSET